MDISQQKEQFSQTYVRAIAIAAGYSLYKPEVDDDSVDLGIAAKGGKGYLRSPRLELQLKCTSQTIADRKRLKYPLSLKNYNDLRANVHVPRLLVVVLVPERPMDWLQHSEEALCMKHCGYWISLRGQSATQNTTAVTIELPRSNQFTVEALQGIVELISQGGFP